MVERFQQERPSWTSESPERRQQRRAQLQTNRDCALLAETAEEVAGAALTVASGAVFFSGVIQLGEQRRARELSVWNTVEMEPRRRTDAHLLRAAGERVAAEQHTVEAEQHAAGQHKAAGHAVETMSSPSQVGREKRDRRFRGHGRGAAVIGQGKDRTSTSFKDKGTGDAIERTPSSSPSLSWEDVEDSLAGMNAYAIRHAECQSSMQRTSKHQHLLRSRGGLETFWLAPAQESATSAFSDGKPQPSSQSNFHRARAHSTADAYSPSDTVAPCATRQRSIRELRSFRRSSLTASTVGIASRCPVSSKKGGDGGVEEGSTAQACSSAAFPLFDARRQSRRRALSCPCSSERTLRSAHRTSLSYTPFAGSSAASSAVRAGEASNMASLCVPAMSPSCTADQYSTVVKSRTSGPSSFPHCQRTSERVFGSNPAAEANTLAAEHSDSGRFVCSAPSSQHPLGSRLICPFYARGLCPAGAAAAAALRTPLQEGKVFAENFAADGAPASMVTGSTLIAPLTRDSGTRPERLPANSAQGYAGAAVQRASDPPECDACSYCMDACDNMSCIRCLPRRSHPDALPPYVFNKDPGKSPSCAADTYRQAMPSAGDPLHMRSYGEEAGAFSLRTRGLTSSPGGSAGEVSKSAEVISPLCSRLTSQTDVSLLPARGTLVEETDPSYSPTTRGWVRTASAPATGIKPETMEKKNTAERWRLGAGWAPCSWFPYRCLRVLAPPARPLVSYSQCQVDRYCRNGGCWLLANGLIYDAFPILYAHPGGPSCLLRKRGQDCSRDFSFHSKRGQQLWSNFVVGRIKPCKGWTERKKQRKEHPSAGTFRQEKQERLILQRMADTPTSESEFSSSATGARGSGHESPTPSVQGAGKVASAGDSSPEQCEPSPDTRAHARDNLADGQTERSDGKNISDKPSVLESTSLCRVM